MSGLPFEELASDVLRAVRGPRSQLAFSRRLGYRTNVAYRWEAGRRFPTAAQTFGFCQKVGIDVRAALRRFRSNLGPIADALPPDDPELIRRVLDVLTEGTTIVALAGASGSSRFAIRRYLEGQAQPRLPQFLRLVDAASNRVLDLLGELVDVATLPSVAEQWRRLEVLRRLAYEHPLSEAILAVLETRWYATIEAHEPGLIAARLGIPEDVEASTLDALAQARVVYQRDERWHLDPDRSIDTSRDRQSFEKLKRRWVREAAERFDAGAPGLLSYVVMSVSEDDIPVLAELFSEYYMQARRIIEASRAPDRVVLMNMHFCALDQLPLSAVRQPRAPSATQRRDEVTPIAVADENVHVGRSGAKASTKIGDGRRGPAY